MPCTSGLQPFEETAHPVPDPVGPVPFALQHPVPVFRLHLLPGQVRGNAPVVGEAHQVLLTLGIAVALKRLDRPVDEGLAGIGHHQVVVDADGATESPAGLAGPQRGVEGKQVGCRVTVMDVAVRAVQVGGETKGRGGVGLRSGSRPFPA